MMPYLAPKIGTTKESLDLAEAYALLPPWSPVACRYAASLELKRTAAAAGRSSPIEHPDQSFRHLIDRT